MPLDGAGGNPAFGASGAAGSEDPGAAGTTDPGFGGAPDAPCDAGSDCPDSGQSGADAGDAGPGLDCPPGVLCLPCTKAEDCTLYSNPPICDPTLGRCVQCESAAECMDRQNFDCNPVTQQCERTCTMNSDCPSQGSARMCRRASGFCVECLDDSDCRIHANRQFCVANTCVECYAGDTSACTHAQPDCVSFNCVCRPGSSPNSRGSCDSGFHCDITSGACRSN